MALIKDANFKDAPVHETIDNIYGILDDYDIKTDLTWFDSGISNTHSVRVEIEGTNVGTNGKGVTAPFAHASALAEFLERLQNGTLLSLIPRSETSGYIYEPDEVVVTLEEYSALNNPLIDEVMENSLFSKLYPEQTKRQVGRERWLGLNKPSNDVVYCIPYYAVDSGREALLPYFMKSVYGTNGMAAGNTVTEAIAQAISEIVERYVQIDIITNEITPPRVGRELLKRHFATSYAVMEEIEASGFGVEVLDCSLGKGYPVIAIIIRNEGTGDYLVNFGCHPNLEIAVSRCFTEIFQGRNLSHVCGSYSNPNIPPLSHENILSLLRNAIGVYPEALFNDAPTYESTIGAFEAMPKNNDQIVKYYRNLLLENGVEIYARNVSFMGFPSVHVIIPGMSEVYNQGELTIRYKTKMREVRRLLKSGGDFPENELETTYEFMKYNYKTPHIKKGLQKYIGGKRRIDPAHDHDFEVIALIVLALRFNRKKEALYFVERLNDPTRLGIEPGGVSSAILDIPIHGANERGEMLPYRSLHEVTEGFMNVCEEAQHLHEISDSLTRSKSGFKGFDEVLVF